MPDTKKGRQIAIRIQDKVQAELEKIFIGRTYQKIGKMYKRLFHCFNCYHS